MKTRLNKFLADHGVCSRREADKLIEQGVVRINGNVATLGMGVEDEDTVAVRGKAIRHSKPAPIYLAFHKPVGLITSVDERLPDNVISSIGHKERIFPIGRLDVASSGLLLLTNDGRFAEAITHPRSNHEKEYVVTVHRPLKEEDRRKMEEGMMILGKMTKPARVVDEDGFTFRITITEGRNRQIRRMCEALEYDVKKLKRVRVMSIELGNLRPGAWRNLTEEEVAQLKKEIEK